MTFPEIFYIMRSITNKKGRYAGIMDDIDSSDADGVSNLFSFCFICKFV